jgi:excisionase family DNA binding protein
LAANFLNKINPQTVLNWFDHRELPAVRVGARRVRIRESDCNAFVAAGEMRGVSDSDPDHAAQWREVRAAIDRAAAAARSRDRAALQKALENLLETASTLEES